MDRVPPRPHRASFVVASAALSLAAASPAPPPAPPQATAVRVVVDTIAVDRRGTWNVGSDEADLFPGTAGTLERSATLIGRRPPHTSEMVHLQARVTPEVRDDGSCSVALSTEVRAVAAGPRTAAGKAAPARRTVRLDLAPDEARLVEVYASPGDGRLALKVRCAAAVPAAAARFGPAPRIVDFVVAVARGDGEDDVKPLKSDGLRATLGGEASNFFSFNVPLPDGKGGAKRYRRERLEVALAPQIVTGNQLQLDVRVRGDLATVSATDGTLAHPVDLRERLILRSGAVHPLEVDVRSAGPDEGWTRVRYRLSIHGKF